MSNKKTRNIEAKKKPRKINETHPDGNRQTRRTKIARERQTLGEIKKRNIKNAHDKTMQRALAKIDLEKNK